MTPGAVTSSDIHDDFIVPLHSCSRKGQLEKVIAAGINHQRSTMQQGIDILAYQSDIQIIGYWLSRRIDDSCPDIEINLICNGSIRYDCQSYMSLTMEAGAAKKKITPAMIWENIFITIVKK